MTKHQTVLDISFLEDWSWRLLAFIFLEGINNLLQ